MERFQLIQNHLRPNLVASPSSKSDDDIVICGAVRTPLTKAKKGPLRDTPSEIVVSHVIKALQQRTGVDLSKIEDITFGNVLQTGSSFHPARIGQFLADVPYTVPIVTTNRLCSSGLEACAQIAAKIKAGIIDIGIAGGFENMSRWNLGGMFD